MFVGDKGNWQIPFWVLFPLQNLCPRQWNTKFCSIKMRFSYAMEELTIMCLLVPHPTRYVLLFFVVPYLIFRFSSMHSMIYLLPYLYQSKTSSHGVLSKSINISMLHHLLLVLAANVGDMSASCHRLVTLSPWLATTGLSWRQKRCDVVIYPCRRAIIESVPAKKMRMSRPPKFYLFSPLPT